MLNLFMNDSVLNSEHPAAYNQKDADLRNHIKIAWMVRFRFNIIKYNTKYHKQQKNANKGIHITLAFFNSPHEIASTLHTQQKLNSVPVINQNDIIQNRVLSSENKIFHITLCADFSFSDIIKRQHPLSNADADIVFMKLTAEVIIR